MRHALHKFILFAVAALSVSSFARKPASSRADQISNDPANKLIEQKLIIVDPVNSISVLILRIRTFDQKEVLTITKFAKTGVVATFASLPSDSGIIFRFIEDSKTLEFDLNEKMAGRGSLLNTYKVDLNDGENLENKIVKSRAAPLAN